MYYTRKKDRLYAHMIKWPRGSALHLNAPVVTSQTTVSLLGYEEEVLRWEPDTEQGFAIRLPSLTPDLIPCEHAWVLVLTGIDNLDPPGDPLEPQNLDNS